MRKVKQNIKDKEKLSERIIRLGRSENISGETRRIISGWLSDEDGAGEKETALENVMLDLLAYDNRPSVEAQKRLVQLRERNGITEPMKPTVRKARLALFRISSVAAVILAFLGISFLFLDKKTDGTPPGGDRLADLVITAGDTVCTAALDDGTEVWLREGSTLTQVASAENERRVSLDGEAIFDVVNDDNKPFIVETDQLEVKVLGTEFDVRAYPDTGVTEVMLFEGSVEVAAGNNTAQLYPGEKLTYRHDTGEMSIDAMGPLADWRLEAIKIADKTLSEMFDAISEYYNVKIIYNAEYFPSGDKYETTLRKNTTPEEVLERLAVVSGTFGFEVLENQIHIYTD